jgi:hypothetical protein
LPVLSFAVCAKIEDQGSADVDSIRQAFVIQTGIGRPISDVYHHHTFQSVAFSGSDEGREIGEMIVPTRGGVGYSDEAVEVEQLIGRTGAGVVRDLAAGAIEVPGNSIDTALVGVTGTIGQNAAIDHCDVPATAVHHHIAVLRAAFAC